MAEKSWPHSGGHHRLAGLYELQKTLGRGHFAVVRLARHVFTGENVAIKVIDKTKLDQTSMDHLYHEVMCMKLVQHPNVVRLYEVIETPSRLYLILELGDGGDMYDYIMRHDQGLDEEQAKEYFAQILCAISYCHKMHVVHRDLKPENIVFFESQGLVKLTDFGFSNRYDPGKKLSTSCGSLAYSAPEILLGEEYDAQAVDVWSLGVILYMLVCGEAPFNEANDSETLTNIMDCKYTVLDHVNKDCRDLIKRMIIREPNERLKLEDIRNHPWLKNCATLRDDVYNSTPVLTRDLISEELHLSIIERMVQGNLAERNEIEEAINDHKYNHITSTYFLLAHRSLDVIDGKQPECSNSGSEVKAVPMNITSGNSNNVFLPQNTDNLPMPKPSVSYGMSPPYQASVIPVIQTGLHSNLPSQSESEMAEDSSPASSNSSLYLPGHLHKGDRKMSPPFPRDHLTITPRYKFNAAKGGIYTLIEDDERSRSQTTTDDDDDDDDENITCARIINSEQLASQVPALKRLKKRKSAPVLNEICEENENETTDAGNFLECAFSLRQDAKHLHRRRHTASLSVAGRLGLGGLSRQDMEVIDSDVFDSEELSYSEDIVPELHQDTMQSFSTRQGRGRKRGGHKSSGSETSDDDSESWRTSHSNLHSVFGSLGRPRRDSSGDRDGASGGGGRGAWGRRRNSGPAGFSSSRNADTEMGNSENASNQNSSSGETGNNMKETEADNNNCNNSTQADMPQERAFFRCITPNILMPASSSDSGCGENIPNNFRGRNSSRQHPVPFTHICNIPGKRSKSAESNQSAKSNNNSSQTSSARSSSSSLSIGYRRGRILTGHRVRKNSRSTMSDTGLVLRWNNLRTTGIPNSSSSSSVGSLSITIPSRSSSRALCNSPNPLHRPHSEGNMMDEHVRVRSLRSKVHKRQSRSTSLPRPCCYVRNNLINPRAASCGPYISHSTNRKRQCPSAHNAPLVSIQPCIPESQMTPSEPDTPLQGSSTDAKESSVKRSNISLASSTCSASKYAVDPLNELILSPMEEAEESGSGSLTRHGPNMKFFKRTKRSTSTASSDSSQGMYSKYIEENDPPSPTKMGRIKMMFFSHADTIFKRRSSSKTSPTGSTSSKKWVESGIPSNTRLKTIPNPHSYGLVHTDTTLHESALLVRKTRPDCCVVM